jgi:hypothetical protein
MFAGYARDYKWHPLPFPPPYQGFCPNFGPNCRWTHALVDEDCTVLQDNDDNLVLDLASCKVQGGNSGSPIIRNLGGDNDPVYRIVGVIHGGWAAPATARFEHAPRFAANVAVASRDDGSGLAQVFVSDPDVDFIARREREEPSAYGDFGNFAPIFNLTDPGRLTAFRQPDNRPQIVVIAGFVSLYTTYVDPSGAWVSYVEMNGPKGVPVYRDIDSALDAAGNPQLYLAGSDGFIYTRRKETANPLDWRPWELLTDANDFTRVTAVRRLDGSQQVFMYTADGQVFTMYQLTPSANSDWSQAAPFDHAGYLPQLEDLDVSLRDDGGLDVFAVAYADGGLWKRGTFGPEPGSGWSLVWSEWDVPLYTPNVNTDHYIEGLLTLTADLWPEEDGKDLVPVVFATDSRGNVYFTTYDKFMGWQRWRSFYQ